MSKQITLTVNESQLRNIAQGLDLTHTKIMDTLAAINSNDDKGVDLRAYFKEKANEVKTQILQVNDLLS